MRRIDITGTLEEGSFFEGERPFYQFRAICTSDNCRSDRKSVIKTITGPGVIKNVKKTASWCPDCEEALFWEKTRIK